MNRKQRRARDRAAKKATKKDTAMQRKLGLFEKIPKNCLTCNKKFDKLDKQMVMSWNVVVREQDGIVRLYCPECWRSAMAFTNKMHNEETND